MMEGPVPSSEPPAIETWRISLPNVQGQGWAIIFMDSTGCFAALSDYGDVSYRWNQRGLPDGGFKRFILKADDYYLTGKFGQGRRVYDGDATYESIKDHILQARKDDSMSKEKARQEYDHLKLHHDLKDREFDFGLWYNGTELDDAGEFYCQKYDRDVTCFVKFVLPRLREYLRQDLGLTPEEARVE